MAVSLQTTILLMIVSLKCQSHVVGWRMWPWTKFFVGHTSRSTSYARSFNCWGYGTNRRYLVLEQFLIRKLFNLLMKIDTLSSTKVFPGYINFKCDLITPIRRGICHSQRLC
jgi:hypothetical protein